MPEEVQDLNQTIKQYLGLAIRRRWWILPTACAVAAAAALGSLLLPNRYTSTATILVVQQQVPERYVVPNTTYSVQEALQSLSEAVLSRSRLFPMIDEFALYPRERHRLGPDGLVQLMRSNIKIEPIQKNAAERDINAFKISFTARSPLVAREVTQQLTSFFINENLRLQEQQDTGTTGFLKDQLMSAQQALQAQEQHLRDFRMSHLGELPEQEQGNLEILAGLHSQLQSTMAELNRAQEQRVYLSSLLDQYRNLSAVGESLPGGAATADPVRAAQLDLSHLEAQRTSLLARYTPQYPDVLDINRKIAQQKILLAHLISVRKTQASKQPTASATPKLLTETSSEAQIRSQLKVNRLQMEDLARGQKRLEQQIAVYEQRLNQTPVRQEQLSDILRGYGLAKKHYDKLLSDVTQSEMATNLAQRQQGQQFRVIDPPTVPTEPSSPERSKIAAGGAAAGLLLGAALAFLIDSEDHSFRSEKDIINRFKLAFVVGLPLLLTPAEERKRSRKRILEWIGATVLLVAVFAAEFYVYRKG